MRFVIAPANNGINIIVIPYSSNDNNKSGLQPMVNNELIPKDNEKIPPMHMKFGMDVGDIGLDTFPTILTTPWHPGKCLEENLNIVFYSEKEWTNYSKDFTTGVFSKDSKDYCKYFD